MNGHADYIIRPLEQSEIHLLRKFLYEAIYIPEGVEPPSKNVVDLPGLKVYIEDFGKKKDDLCLVAEVDGYVVGAVWTRIMNDYGHVDDKTPSLSISLDKEYRNKGIGTCLMRRMMDLLGNKGYRHVSLSVQKENYAFIMYMNLGFRIIRETEDEFIMVRNITDEITAENVYRGYVIRHLDERDILQMRELFQSTVLNVNIRDYTEEEVQDWASCGNETEHWRNLVCENTFVGAFDENGLLVGFSSMNRAGHLHSMFVHKDFQGRGVATALLAEVEKLAVDYGVAEITSEVSLTAEPFFRKNGYETVKVQKQRANRLELVNSVMRKLL